MCFFYIFCCLIKYLLHYFICIYILFILFNCPFSVGFLIDNFSFCFYFYSNCIWGCECVHVYKIRAIKWLESWCFPNTIVSFIIRVLFSVVSWLPLPLI